MSIKTKNRVILFPRLTKALIIFFAAAFIAVGFKGYQLFQYVFEENVKTPGSITIPTDASFDQVLDSLRAQDILIKEKGFIWVAKKKDYPDLIKPGVYVFDLGMNNNTMVNMLKAGNQKPVSITFNNLRFMEELAGKVAQYIEPDSLELITYLRDPNVIQQMGFNEYTFHAMFIPNTYEMYWTTTPKQFVERMKAEYDRFWNSERKSKADSIGLDPTEVITVASIVQEETIKPEEKPIVAGLYLNRIERGMLLQADPTVKFAVGDFSIQRVLNKHLEIDSPYNTYKYAGLPPGPINFPEISSIDAVLSADDNKYIYMCAREDFSGYHNFASTLSEHNRNAQKYQQALNSNHIWQ